MKALSLTQPWASLVAIGAKAIETRSWSTSFRGPLAIHAAKGMPKDAVDFCREELASDYLIRAGLYPYGDPTDKKIRDRLPLGAIVAVANLHRVGRISRRQRIAGDDVLRSPWLLDTYVDGRELPVVGDELEFGDYTPGRYGWVLTNVRRLPEPILCKGALGLWEVPAEIVEQIQASAVAR